MLHLINSGAAALDGTGQEESGGKAIFKPFWQVTDADVERCLKQRGSTPPSRSISRVRWSVSYKTKGDMPMTMVRINLIKGWAGPSDCRGLFGRTTGQGTCRSGRTHQSYLADDLVRAQSRRQPGFRDVYSMMNNWEQTMDPSVTGMSEPT